MLKATPGLVSGASGGPDSPLLRTPRGYSGAWARPGLLPEAESDGVTLTSSPSQLFPLLVGVQGHSLQTPL